MENIRLEYELITNVRETYISTGKSLTKEEWKSLANMRSRVLNDIKKSVEESFYAVKGHVDTLCQKGDFSFTTLDTRMENSTGNTLNQAFKVK